MLVLSVRRLPRLTAISRHLREEARLAARLRERGNGRRLVSAAGLIPFKLLYGVMRARCIRASRSLLLGSSL